MTEHVLQPEGSMVCGSACVAMALGIPLEEAVSRMGHRRGVRNREMVAALGGRAAARRFVPWPGVPDVPPDSVVRTKGPKSRHHLVYLAPDGRLHDPGISVPAPSLSVWADWLSELGWRPVSYLPLRSLPSSSSASETVSKGLERTTSEEPSREVPMAAADQEGLTQRSPDTVDTT